MLEDPIANQLAEQHILAQTHLGRLNYVVLILDVIIPASRDAFGDGISHILLVSETPFPEGTALVLPLTSGGPLAE